MSRMTRSTADSKTIDRLKAVYRFGISCIVTPTLLCLMTRDCSASSIAASCKDMKTNVFVVVEQARDTGSCEIIESPTEIYSEGEEFEFSQLSPVTL